MLKIYQLLTFKQTYNTYKFSYIGNWHHLGRPYKQGQDNGDPPILQHVPQNRDTSIHCVVLRDST